LLNPRPRPVPNTLLDRSERSLVTSLSANVNDALFLSSTALTKSALETKDMEEGYFKCECLRDVTAEMIAQLLQPPDAAQDLGRC
jgi:hypothetical protein